MFHVGSDNSFRGGIVKDLWEGNIVEIEMVEKSRKISSTHRDDAQPANVQVGLCSL